MYKLDAVAMISGHVIGIEKLVPMKGMHPGIALVVKTEKETLPVHLGPVWYMERLEFKISKGDKLEIKGAKVFLNNQPAVIAGEVKKTEIAFLSSEIIQEYPFGRDEAGKDNRGRFKHKDLLFHLPGRPRRICSMPTMSSFSWRGE